MANCKDCIHYDVCESDSEDVALNLTWANKCQHFKDKADVVPKSEVEKWFRECEELQGRMIELKSEVVEIFEEIEKVFTVKYPMCTNPVLVLDSLSYAELKKKYTESEGKG